MDTRLTDADIGDILDTYLQQQSYNGNRARPLSPFDPSEALFGADAFAPLPGFWHTDAAVGLQCLASFLSRGAWCGVFLHYS